MSGNSTAQRSMRTFTVFMFGALAVFFAVTAAIAVVDGAGSPVVIAVEVLIAVLFGALFHAGRRR